MSAQHSSLAAAKVGAFRLRPHPLPTQEPDNISVISYLFAPCKSRGMMGSNLEDLCLIRWKARGNVRVVMHIRACVCHRNQWPQKTHLKHIRATDRVSSSLDNRNNNLVIDQHSHLELSIRPQWRN